MKKKNLINSKIKNKLSNQKGMALLATLIFVFVLVSLGAALLTMTNNDSKLSTLQKESTRAFYIAETGIEKALWYINFSPDNTAGLDWRTTEDDPPYYTNKELSSEEYFEVVVATDETDSDLKATKISFISTGRVDKGGEYNKGTRKIEVKLIKGIAQNNSLSYNYAIFTENDMTIHGNIYVNGDIHSNGDISVAGAAFDLVNGTATASGTVSGYAPGTSYTAKQAIPIINFEIYKTIAQGVGGVYYGDNTSKVFNTNETLTGIHFVDGDIVVKADLIISDGAIFATGTIKVQGNPDIEIIHSADYDNPLAIIAQGDITMSGNVHGEGVIQTNGSFTLNGTINIEKGCVVAEDGIFNGGGGDMNVVYDNGLQDDIVVGTGIEVWKKASWQEVY
jgi:Tfp pilus assembly protein PilX